MYFLQHRNFDEQYKDHVGSMYQEYGLIGRDAVYIARQVSTLHRTLVLPAFKWKMNFLSTRLLNLTEKRNVF